MLIVFLCFGLIDAVEVGKMSAEIERHLRGILSHYHVHIIKRFNGICNWEERDFTSHRAALAVRHFGSAAHMAQNISQAASSILEEYGIPAEETPVTTDHGSNIVAALKNGMRVDCLCHRLHTVLESAWKETKASEPDAAGYESALESVYVLRRHRSRRDY